MREQLGPFFRAQPAGEQVDLVRVYDSLQRDLPGSFGFGWRLSGVDAAIQTDVPPTARESLGIYNPLRLGTRLNGFAGVNLFKMVTDGGSTSSLGSDAVTWSGRVNGTTEVTKTFIVQASYFYRAPMKIEKGRFEAQQMANLALRKKIDGDNSSVTLRIIVTSQEPLGVRGEHVDQRALHQIFVLGIAAAHEPAHHRIHGRLHALD